MAHMTPSTPAPARPPTPAQKHAQARQSQSLNRVGGVLLLTLLAGLPAVLGGLVLFALVRQNRRRLAILALGMLVGLAVIGLGHRTIIAQAQTIAQLATPYRAPLRAWARKPNAQHWAVLRPAVGELAPHIGRLWLMLLPLAPLVALYLEATRSKTLSEQRAEQARAAAGQEREQRRMAAQKVTQAPEAISGLGVIGAPLGGDLGWITKEWAIYSATMLNRHAVIVGGSGTGKTEFILRVAYLARKVYGWKVFYIDAKGDPKNARRFHEVMQQAGVSHTPLFPDDAYNGWVGDAITILNRLLAVEDYSEPYYKAVAKTVLTLAVKPDSGPPRSSHQFLERLHMRELDALYTGQHTIRTDALSSLTEENINGVLRRYFGFFDALSGKLDGGWSFDTVDAGYLLLEGLALKEEARSLGRYLLEDFANYASKRKRGEQQILLIIDEFSALSAGGADAANLFERLRSFGAGIMVTSQTGEGLGEDARKLIGAAAVTIAFQSADPEYIAARAGSRREVQTSLAVEHAAQVGRNPLMSGRNHMSGTSVEREQEVPTLHPDVIRRLAVGECCIIANGAYQAVRVAQLKQPTGVRGRRRTHLAPAPAPTATPTTRAVRIEPPISTVPKQTVTENTASADAPETALLATLAATSVTVPLRPAPHQEREPLEREELDL